MRLRYIFTVICVSLTAAAAYAGELDGLSVYRKLDGSFSATSLREIATLKRAAAAQGTISIWVGFDMEFESNPNLQTQAIKQRESAVKQGLVDRIVKPLVDRGHARVLPLTERQASAPGIMLAVTAPGLAELVKNVEVKFVAYIPS